MGYYSARGEDSVDRAVDQLVFITGDNQMVLDQGFNKRISLGNDIGKIFRGVYFICINRAVCVCVCRTVCICTARI